MTTPSRNMKDEKLENSLIGRMKSSNNSVYHGQPYFQNNEQSCGESTKKKTLISAAEIPARTAPGEIMTGFRFPSSRPATMVPSAMNEESFNELARLPELRNRVRRYVEEIIKTSYGSSESAAYRSAMELNPELVRTETDALQFVRYCRYDVLAGARRLCLYWTERLKLFGPQRAFLPLTLTGTGALTPEDLLTLRAGFPVLLPNTRSGHGCFLVDRRKRIASAPVEQMLRCFFYIYKILAQNDLSQIDEEGAYCLIVSVTPRTKGFPVNDVHVAASLTTRIFPVKLRFHLLSIPNQIKQNLASEMVQALSLVLRDYFLQTKLHMQIHVETEPNQILEELIELGLTTKGIPFFLGGEWKFEDFSDWCEKQIVVEQNQFKNYLLKEDNMPNGTRPLSWSKFNRRNVIVPNNGSVSSSSDELGSAEPFPIGVATGEAKASRKQDKPQLTREERVAKRKIADMLYSRRKREREHVKLQQLKDESSQLQHEKELLLREHEQLECLWAQAQTFAAACDMNLR